MDLETIRQRLSEVRSGLVHLGEQDELTDEQARDFDWLDAEETWLAEQEQAAEERATRAAAVRRVLDEGRGGEAGFEVPNVNRGESRDDPYDLSTLRVGEDVRGRAEKAIERTVGDLSDDMRESAVRTLRKVKDPTGVLARRILATGTPEYRSAAQKLMGGQGQLMSDAERQAVQRAQSLTDADGGFAIPFTLDPTIIYTGDGASNPFRRVSRIEQIVTDSWNGVSSGGVSGGYAAEASEVGDDSATLAQPSVTPERWDVFVPFSFEVGQDWANIESDVRMLVDQQRTEFDVTAFTTGSGSDEPTGIITALDGGDSEIAPATAETFAVGDVYNLTRVLPPGYRITADQPAWMGELGTYNEVRQFDTQGGGNLWTQLGGGTPERLLGYRTFENSAMDSSVDIDDSATADHFILVLGDWSHYLIVDRVGLNFELVPHLFATANNRPSGERGFLAWGRTGADSVNDNAFVTLSIPTTA